jgi:hypothetical protein
MAMDHLCIPSIAGLKKYIIKDVVSMAVKG